MSQPNSPQPNPPSPFDPPATPDLACVLYAADSGRIIFVHHRTTLGHAPPPSEADFVAQTRALFESGRNSFHNPLATDAVLESLVVPSASLRLPGHILTVDHASRSLVSHPRPR